MDVLAGKYHYHVRGLAEGAVRRLYSRGTEVGKSFDCPRAGDIDNSGRSETLVCRRADLVGNNSPKYPSGNRGTKTVSD